MTIAARIFASDHFILDDDRIFLPFGDNLPGWGFAYYLLFFNNTIENDFICDFNFVSNRKVDWIYIFWWFINNDIRARASTAATNPIVIILKRMKRDTKGNHIKNE